MWPICLTAQVATSWNDTKSIGGESYQLFDLFYYYYCLLACPVSGEEVPHVLHHRGFYCCTINPLNSRGLVTTTFLQITQIHMYMRTLLQIFTATHFNCLNTKYILTCINGHIRKRLSTQQKLASAVLRIIWYFIQSQTVDVWSHGCGLLVFYIHHASVYITP